jgi:hypothetical protein
MLVKKKERKVKRGKGIKNKEERQCVMRGKWKDEYKN